MEDSLVVVSLNLFAIQMAMEFIKDIHLVFLVLFFIQIFLILEVSNLFRFKFCFNLFIEELTLLKLMVLGSMGFHQVNQMKEIVERFHYFKFLKFFQQQAYYLTDFMGFDELDLLNFIVQSTK